MSKLIEQAQIKSLKNIKQKTPTDQENVRQNLSRRNNPFRNVKDPNTGKSTGYWEVVESESRSNTC